IQTLPAERYAALLINHMRITAPQGEMLERSLRQLADQPYSPELWESVILPARVSGYRPELLDTLLSQGNLFWHITQQHEISFHLYEDIDWEADMSGVLESLEGKEKIIYEALLQRGASFMQRLSGLLDGVTPYDTLLDLAEKGLVCADSFLPVRQWMNKENIKSGSIKQRVSARSKALTTGRWEIARPLKELAIEEKIERIFDRVAIICRETVQGLLWTQVLETLRVWEYTGLARRGYFIEGLSGVQFIRDKDFVRTMQELTQPQDEIIWLSAVDPAQPWGKCLPHMQDRSFMNIPGNAVALRAGRPIAIFERQGKVLRVFETESLTEALRVFIKDYARMKILPTQGRLVIKQYPEEAVDSLAAVGFMHELQDYVIYRGIM
ncbi:MAG: DEAD/DEAH box helicase, partial [Mobilitalea sp.]